MNRPGKLELFVRTVIGRSYPRIIGLQREKSWLFFDLLLPFLQVSAFVYIYRAIEAPQEFIGFVVLGGAMTAYWLNVLWGMASQLYWEKETGNLQLYIMAPTSRMAVLMGMAVGGIVATTFRAIVVVLIGITLFGVRFYVADFGLFLAVFVVTLIALYGMGMLFSSLFLLYGREAWHLSNLLQEPIYLLSGFYFPVSKLSFWTAVGVSIIPITLGLDAMRQLLFPTMAEEFRFLPVSTELLILVALAVIFVGFAGRALNFMERLAREQGRLSVRGQ